jgi:hypothetical protein
MSRIELNTLTLQEKIDLVKTDILTRFPGCSHTVTIRLWDDGTDSVECRHGDDDDFIHYSLYYDNELTFTSFKLDGRVMIVDEEGGEHYKYLVDEKPTGKNTN